MNYGYGGYKDFKYHSDEILKLQKEVSILPELVKVRKEIIKIMDKNPCNGKCSSCWDSVKRCCNNCEKYGGYYHFTNSALDFVTISKLTKKTPIEIFNYLDKLFDEENGFWGENGCKVPREMRSFTCITYLCYNQAQRNHKLTMRKLGKLYRTKDKFRLGD